MIALPANLSIWLAAQVVLVGVLVLFSTIYSRARGRFQQAKTLADLQRSSNLLVGMTAGLLLFDFLALAAIGVALGGSGWMLVGAAALVGAWVIWNLPARNRMIIVDAETDIVGDPYEVSAFFADVRSATRWVTGLISIVEEGASLQGPRFHIVGLIPGTAKQLEGDLVLRANEPGKEVIVGVEGEGLTADHYILSPSESGTHLLYRTVLEMPFVMAVGGRRFWTRDTDRPRRHTEELARAKAVFEAAHADASHPLDSPPHS